MFFEMVDSASGYYRMILPNNELIKNGIPVVTMAGLRKTFRDQKKFHDMSERYLKSADVVVMEMPAKMGLEPILEWSNFANIPVLIEADDMADKTTDWINKASGNRAKDVWLQRSYLWNKADGFICSTKYLSDYYGGKFNKPAVTFMNQLDFDSPRWDVEKKKHEGIVIGFMGSQSHRPDVLIAKDAILKILDEYPAVKFKFVGFHSGDIIHDRVEYIESSKHGNRELNKMAGFFELYEYPLFMDWDIGIIPLLDNEFNRAKSDIKFLEYSRLKVPAVISKVSTYHTVTDKETGVLVTDNKWYEGLKYLIDRPKKRKEIAEKAFEYVRDRRNIKDHWSKYERILQQAIARKGPRRKPNTLSIVKNGRVYA